MRWLHSGGEEADSDCGREEAAGGSGLALVSVQLLWETVVRWCGEATGSRQWAEGWSRRGRGESQSPLIVAQVLSGNKITLLNLA
jgi:hypothetical protein